jgi:hypothetical protein
MKSAAKLSGILAGVSGEYFVAAQLSRLGYIASITLKNTKGVDVLATNADATKSVTIQVKTNQGKRKAWLLNEKSENTSAKNLVYVLVNLKNKNDMPDFYIVPSGEVAERVKTGYQKWLETPGKKGKKHNENPMRMFEDRDGRYLNRWDLLRI